MNYKEVFQLAQRKGYKLRYSDSQLEATRSQEKEEEMVYIELALIQRWLREHHYTWVHINLEVIGSDEWVYVYEITYLPRENWNDKRRCPSFQYKESFAHSGGATYAGGWDTYEEALLEGIKKALSLLSEK